MSANPYTTIDMEPIPPSFHLLPSNLAGLADVCARENWRYSLAGVRIAVCGDTYRAEATDGKTLVRVEGESDDARLYPELSALVSAPNGQTSALVPSKDWKEAFRGAEKIRAKPLLRNVAAVLGDQVVTLATTDLDSQRVTSPRQVDGRFPDTDLVTPKRTAQPVVSVCFDAKRLIDLLKVALAFVACDEPHAVTLDVFDPASPVRVTTGNGQQRFTGLIMPLT